MHSVKVFFELQQDEDGYPPVTCESLWATPVGNGLYRFDNIPFFARGVAYEDVVSAVRRDAKAPELRRELEALGCDTEQSHIPNLFAVDVPPSVSLEEVRRLLETGDASEHWEYEEACLERP